MRVNNHWLLLGVVTLFFVAVGCGKLDHKKNIIGIWRLHSINVNGQEIGDNKGYIRFWEDGRAMVRTGVSIYEQGKWEIHPEDGKIIMLRDTARAEYFYEMSQDSILMTRKAPPVITVLHGVKVEDYPVSPESEGADPALFK